MQGEQNKKEVIEEMSIEDKAINKQPLDPIIKHDAKPISKKPEEKEKENIPMSAYIEGLLKKQHNRRNFLKGLAKGIGIASISLPTLIEAAWCNYANHQNYNNHGNYADHSDYSNHSNYGDHSDYGDHTDYGDYTNSVLWCNEWGHWANEHQNGSFICNDVWYNYTDNSPGFAWCWNDSRFNNGTWLWQNTPWADYGNYSDGSCFVNNTAGEINDGVFQADSGGWVDEGGWNDSGGWVNVGNWLNQNNWTNAGGWTNTVG